MTKAEVSRKLDEIVDFAGVARYLDTPVKRYSSGMMVRLGFAVAAHLEPEILIVDEVLAVGDAEFQKKAVGKMQEVSSKGGRTVLFVSHNMGSVKKLCNKGILLQDGQISYYGNTQDVLSKYLSYRNTFHQENIHFSSCKSIKLITPFIIGENGQRTEEIQTGSPIKFKFSFDLSKEQKSLTFGVAISNQFGTRICTMHSIDDDQFKKHYYSPGRHEVEMIIPKNNLAPGNYTFLFGIRDASNINVIKSNSEIPFTIHSHGHGKDGHEGIIWPTTHWIKKN